ncbi:NAD(P)-binding protein [Hypoxylon sp. NC1633]|nr:NAD(P)-binding protein [Hypoxylon sp. NC1633]
MTNSTVVLITGVGRGIGKGLAEAYLQRPNHTVIGSVRDKTAPSAQALKSLPAAPGSRLILVSIESRSATDVPAAIKEIEAAGVTHINVVIANAGYSPTPGPLDDVEVDDVVDASRVNAVALVYLYQGVRKLLEKAGSGGGRPVWCSVSSAAGSIGGLEEYGTHIVLAYGMSKAAQNFFTRALHSANKWLIAYAIHPGLVQTDMGNVGARMIGLEKAPTTVDEAVEKTMATIDDATREKTSGKFLNVIDGTEFPW